MHNTTTFCRILLWIVLVLVCAVQIMTIVHRPSHRGGRAAAWRGRAV